MSISFRFIHYKFHDGVADWQTHDARGAAQEEPEGAQLGDAGAGQGAAGEDHRRHQEDSQAGADGHCQNNGPGEIRTI